MMVLGIVFSVLFFALVIKYVDLEKDYLESTELFNSEITFLEDKVEELESGISNGTVTPKCDRENPWHSTIAWYLSELEIDPNKFTENEKEYYNGIIELNKWYLFYKDQPLQMYRNNSVIWENAWCHKWADGIGEYGLGHEHWIAGEFSFNFKTNSEFKEWLVSGGQTGYFEKITE